MSNNKQNGKETIGLLAFDPNPAPQSLFYRHPYVESRKAIDVSMAYGTWEIPHLLDLLHPDLKPRHLHHALEALGDRMSHQEQKAQALAAGGAAKVTALLKHPDLRVKKLACDIVGHMSTLLQGRDALTEAGAVSIFADILLEERTSSAIETSIGRSLNMFACMPHCCREIERSALEALIKYLKKRLRLGDERSYCQANVDFLECLAKVIMATRSDRLLNTGVISLLVSMISHPLSERKKYKNMTAAILGLIRALGTYHAQGREEILANDNMTTLIHALDFPDEQCREMATVVLGVVSLQLRAKQLMTPAAFRLWELYTTEGETPFCKQMAIQVIRTVQEWEAFRSHFVRTVLTTVGERSYPQLEEMFGIHLIRAVYALLKTEGFSGPECATFVPVGIGALYFIATKEPTAGDVISGSLALSPETPPANTATYMWESLPDFVAFMVDLIGAPAITEATKSLAHKLLRHVIDGEPRAKTEQKSHESRLPAGMEL
eukprot:GEMP01029336.1.p1 GENE.GEMP01029336.1~~GEMP01029336.1.p1  ORF type:complete len:493 (+),score=126.96 GEMP01029336.1:40-1518(+)